MQLARFVENAAPSNIPMPKHAVRVVAGTAVNLQVLVEQGLFREDLFFELSVAVLNVPIINRPARFNMFSLLSSAFDGLPSPTRLQLVFIND